MSSKLVDSTIAPGQMAANRRVHAVLVKMWAKTPNNNKNSCLLALFQNEFSNIRDILWQIFVSIVSHPKKYKEKSSIVLKELLHNLSKSSKAD